MKTTTWILVIGVSLTAAFHAIAEEEEERGRLDRTPLITMPAADEDAAEPAQEAEPRKEMTMEERVKELEHLVDRLVRSVDPYGHRDEWRLERRIRDLERDLESLQQEIRRMEQRLRIAETRR